MKALVLVLAAVVGCGGRMYVAECNATDAGPAQVCSPPSAPQFCCPADTACGTGSIESGGNGCAVNECCPSPVASQQ